MPRPPPEGPGSPYAIDPRSTGSRAVIKDSSSGNCHQQHPSSHPHDRCQQHQHQHQKPAGESNPSFKDSATYDGGRAGAGERGSGATLGGYARADGERDTARGVGQRRTRREHEDEQQRQRKLGNYSESYDSGHRGSDASALHGRPYGKPAAHTKGGGGGGNVDKISNNRRDRSPDRRRAWGGDDDRDDGRGNRNGQNSGREARGGMSGSVGGVSSGAVFGGYAGDLPEDAFPGEEVELVECRECGRKFKEEALERHANACRTVFLAKRKVMMIVYYFLL